MYSDHFDTSSREAQTKPETLDRPTPLPHLRADILVPGEFQNQILADVVRVQRGHSFGSTSKKQPLPSIRSPSLTI